MKKNSWLTAFSIVLVLLSAVLYFAHYMVFRDMHHILIYLLGDIAFLPIEVLLVTIIIHRLLNEREKREMLSKMNMVIGVFFDEVGTEFLELASTFLEDGHSLQKLLMVDSKWSDTKFNTAIKEVKKMRLIVDNGKGELEKLKQFLIYKRPFLLGLMGNSNLLEHYSFTEMLLASFHLVEELSSREDIADLPAEDYNHLTVDLKRAYQLLICEWILYMKHLKEGYPYLFSLAIRKNPFNPESSVIIDK